MLVKTFYSIQLKECYTVIFPSFFLAVIEIDMI